MKMASLGLGNGARLVLAVGAISLLVSQHATATNLFWSGNGTTQGGVGTWNTTTARFGTVAAGPYTTTWNNANVDSAEFGNAGGLVNLGGPIVVNTITTSIAGVTIGNGNGVGNATNTITFSGANAGVNTTHTSGTTQLTALVSGTLTKTGVGRLELNNTANPNTSKYVINAGIISTPAISRFGSTAPASLVSDFLTFNGGGWGINTGNQDTGANRGITVKSGGAFFGSTSTTVNITISSPIVGTEGGGISIVGNSGPFLNSAHTAGAILVLSNTGNSWNGDATLNGPSGSRLKLGASGVIPDTAVVHILASGNTFDLNGFDETVKSIEGTAGTVALGTNKLTIANPNGEASASVLTGTAGAQLIKNGSGALSLSGSSTGFSGEVILNAGTLGIGGANSLGSNAAGPTFQVNGGKISNTSASGRTMSANLKVNLNVDLVADDSLAATQGQINFTGVSTMVGGDRTFTINGATTNIGFADLREDVAGRSVTKNGTGTLAFTGTATGTAFTGDVTVNAGRAQVTGTSIIGTGNNLVKLNGGALNSSANRAIATDPISNPVSVTDNSAITTTSTATTVNMAFTSNSFSGTSGKTLTFQNIGANDAGDTFYPRLMGSGFDFVSDIAIANGGTGKTQLEFANTGATVQTFSGTISGDGKINRTSGNVGSGNGGTTILTGANTYTGGTLVEEGTLLANNTTGSATGTGDVTVTGGKLGGTGKIGGNVLVSGGSLSPGASINVLDIGGNLTMTGGSFDYEINSSTVTADLNTVAGNLSLSSVALSGSELGSGLLAMGTKFTLINYGGTWNGGIFTGLPNYSTTLTIGANRFAIRYDDTTGGSNFGGGAYGAGSGDPHFVTITAVPEASMFLTIGLGGIFAIAAVWAGRRMGVNILKV